MPFILLHAPSSRVFTCKLVNHYDLEYYGVAFWDDRESASQQFEHMLTTHGVSNPEGWTVKEIDESVMKLCNVKLKNDPANRLYLDEESKPVIQREGSE